MKKTWWILLSSLAILSGCSATNASSSVIPQGTDSFPSLPIDSSIPSNPRESAPEDSYEADGEVVKEVRRDLSQFSKSDSKVITANDVDALITLDGDNATLSDSTRGSFQNGVLTLTRKGTYRIKGNGKNITILVNDETKSGKIHLLFDNVTMTNDSKACLFVQKADKVVVHGIGENNLTANFLTPYEYDDKEVDGTIYARDDITFSMTGSMNLKGKLNGIVAKDDFKFTEGNLSIEAEERGISANDSVRIKTGTMTIHSKGDGIHLKNDDSTSYFYMESGSLQITSDSDAIEVTAKDKTNDGGKVILAGGNLTLSSGGGSAKNKDESQSQKGISADGEIEIGAVTLNIDSSDDALHSKRCVSVAGGELTLKSSDDAIHASSVLNITSGKVTIEKSYEGLEAYNVIVEGGDIRIASSDDGINAAGGSDQDKKGQDSFFQQSNPSSVSIRGGNLYINSKGDGIDSNGSLFVSGGTTIVEGPTSSANGALDKGDTKDSIASITGGTLLALGSEGMAINFDTGTQPSALVKADGQEGSKFSFSHFSFTATKPFECLVFSSPELKKGSTNQFRLDDKTLEADFTSSLYYSDVPSHGPKGRR